MIESTKNWFLDSHPNLPNVFRWPAELIGALIKDWQSLDDDYVRTWFKRLIIGIVLMFGLLLALVFTVRWLDQSGRLAWEQAWLEGLLEWSSFTIWQAIWMNSFGHTYLFILLVVMVAVLLIKDHKPLLAVTFGGSYLGSGFFVTIGWRIWNRVRPELVLDGIIIPDLHSFPSGHTAQSVAVFGFVAYIWSLYARHTAEKVGAWIVAGLIMGSVILGRLLLGAHWPSDIVGGFILGAAWLAVLIWTLRR